MNLTRANQVVAILLLADRRMMKVPFGPPTNLFQFK
jgi:hypothetical protein